MNTNLINMPFTDPTTRLEVAEVSAPNSANFFVTSLVNVI
jgi:hypothetical protein